MTLLSPDIFERLRRLFVKVDSLGPGLQFPSGLTEMNLRVRKERINCDLLHPLTQLRSLILKVKQEMPPLDFSGFVSLTDFDAFKCPVSRLPTCLVDLSITLSSDFDLSPITRLTFIAIRFKSNVRLTFPVQLKHLIICEGELGESNIKDVALEIFDTRSGHPLTLKKLKKLPKTLREFHANCEQPSLRNRLPILFPRLSKW